MNYLNWVSRTVPKNVLTANVVDVFVDFTDLCKSRFWGQSNFSLNISFSIHKRLSCENGWAYQLLMPNNVHIYCTSEIEAKEIAEKIYKRMMDAFANNTKRISKENFNKLKHYKNAKNKKRKLLFLLNNRGIVGKVYYSKKHPIGWMFVWAGKTLPDRLGFNFAEAVDMIESGTLDFFNEEFKQQQSV